jgi:uroporphyrinogen decarboxylase
LNHRERILAALSHVQPDRCPCDYMGTPEIDAGLRRLFGADADLLDALDTDIRKVGPRYVGPPLRRFPDGSQEDIWGVIRSPMANEYGEYLEPSFLPWKDMTTVEEVEAYRWPRLEWHDFSEVEARCRDLKGYAVGIGGPGWPDMINGVAFGRGVENVILGIATEDPVTLALMRRRASFQLALAERTLEAGRGGIDIVFTGDDYGTQNGLLMHPNTWRRLFRPVLQQFIDLTHSRGAKVIHHSCGSTREIMEDFVQMGLDCLQTIQPRAKGMDPDDLKAHFRGRLAFHGAIDVQGGLQAATPDGVRDMVRRRIRVMGEGGGYICAPSHNIQPDTPIENVLAMYETIHGRRLAPRS